MADPLVPGFLEACSEHHLLKGEEVVGKASTTNQPCFSEDITAFSKTEYPLSHHARVLAAVAILLRSIYTGNADFVLEFFLPLNCKNALDQKKTLDSLSSVLQQACRSLHVITDDELPKTSLPMPGRKVTGTAVGRLDEQIYPKLVNSPSQEPSFPASSRIIQMTKNNREFNMATQWDNSDKEFHNVLSSL